MPVSTAGTEAGAATRVAEAGASAPKARPFPEDSRAGRPRADRSAPWPRRRTWRRARSRPSRTPRRVRLRLKPPRRGRSRRSKTWRRAFAPQQNAAPRAGNSFSRNGSSVQQGGSSAFQRGGNSNGNGGGYAQPRAQGQAGGPVAVPRGGYNRGYSYNNNHGSYNNHGYSYYNGSRYYNGHAYYGHPYYYSYPYYAFRPHFSIGFGFWAGYPVTYPYYYPYYYSSAIPYPYPVPSYPSDSSTPYPGTVAPAATGGLSLEIDPPDAGLFVDGQYIGEVGQFTPNDQPLALTPGRHHIEIRAAGFMSQAFDVDVIAGQVIPYQGRMQPQPQ